MFFVWAFVDEFSSEDCSRIIFKLKQTLWLILSIEHLMLRQRSIWMPHVHRIECLMVFGASSNLQVVFIYWTKPRYRWSQKLTSRLSGDYGRRWLRGWLRLSWTAFSISRYFIDGSNRTDGNQFMLCTQLQENSPDLSLVTIASILLFCYGRTHRIRHKNE